MKKLFVWSLPIVLVMAAGFLIVRPSLGSAQTVPEILDVTATVTLNNISFRWNSNIATTGVVELGTVSGTYTYSIDSSTSTTSHYVWSRDIELEYDTIYYYRITVTDPENTSASTEEFSVTTSSRELRFDSWEIYDIASDKVYLRALTNKSAYPGVKIGTAPDNLTTPDTYEGDLFSIGGAMTQKWVISGLIPDTTYYVQATAIRSGMILGYYEEAESVESEVLTFITTDLPRVNSINPPQGPEGTEVTLLGENFGDSIDFGVGLIGIGCSPIQHSQCHPAELISWSDSTIVVRTNAHSATGPVYVSKRWSISTDETDAFTIQGPEFRVVDGESVTNTTTSGATTYITKAYNCTFSTSIADEGTIRVVTLLTDGNDMDVYLGQVYNAYHDTWGRYPRCDEMQFHLDHATPLDRLTRWLQEETIDEKYGCTYSTTLSDSSTIRVENLFMLGSDDDVYLGQVYNAYHDTWGRYPRCDEMQFHLEHSTPMERLQGWLDENVSKEQEAAEEIPETSSDITGPKIEFSGDGNLMTVQNTENNLIFDENDIIIFTGKTIPNSLVKLVIASENFIEVITRSNNEGYWAYTLTGPLEIGIHTVRVSVNDNFGITVSASETVSFTIKASSKTSKVINTITTALQDVDFSITTWIIIVVAVIILLIVGYLFLRKKKDTEEKQ